MESRLHLGPATNLSFTAFDINLIFAGIFSIWCAPSDERVGLSFIVAAGLYQRCLSWVQVPELETTLYCLNSETPPTWRGGFLYLLPQQKGRPVQLPGIESD
jgi:hypothetical protein